MARTFQIKVTTPLLQINTATPAVVGQVWTATDTAGNGSWQTPSGGGGAITITAPATAGKLVKWATSTSITDSIMTETTGLLSVAGGLTLTSGAFNLTGTVVGRGAIIRTNTIDASGQAGSGNVVGTDDSGVTIKIISGQSVIFDNDGGILSLPTSGAVTIPAVYGGQNPPMTNVGGATTGTNTITLLVSEAIAAQGTLANATVTTAVALDIGAVSASTATNYGVRIAAPTGGTTNIGLYNAGTSSLNNTVTIISPTSSTVPDIIRAAASQTADITEWQDSNSNILSRIDQNGFWTPGHRNASTAWIKDEFSGGSAVSPAGGSTTPNYHGDLGWRSNLTTAASVNASTYIQGHPGVSILATGATAVAAPAATVDLTALSIQFAANALNLFDCIWIVGNVGATNQIVRVGFLQYGQTTSNPSTTAVGAYFLASGTTDWSGNVQGTAAATAVTALSGGVLSPATWYRLRMRYFNNGGTYTIGFSVNNGTEKLITTNIPTATSCIPFIHTYNNNTATNLSAYIDYFDYISTNLNR